MGSPGAVPASRIRRVASFIIFHSVPYCAIRSTGWILLRNTFEYEIGSKRFSLKKKRYFSFIPLKSSLRKNTLWKILCRSGTKFERCTWGKIKICKKGRNDIFVQSETYILTSRVAITLSQFMKTKTRRNFRRALCSPNYGKRTHRAHFA